MCDIVGMYLLSQLKNLDLVIGLYRDDGLAVSNLGERQTKLRKLVGHFRKPSIKVGTPINLLSIQDKPATKK